MTTKFEGGGGGEGWGAGGGGAWPGAEAEMTAATAQRVDATELGRIGGLKIEAIARGRNATAHEKRAQRHVPRSSQLFRRRTASRSAEFRTVCRSPSRMVRI